MRRARPRSPRERAPAPRLVSRCRFEREEVVDDRLEGGERLGGFVVSALVAEERCRLDVTAEERVCRHAEERRDRDELTDQARALRDDLDRWLRTARDPARAARDIAVLQDSVLVTLPDQLALLARALAPGRVTLAGSRAAAYTLCAPRASSSRVKARPSPRLAPVTSSTEFWMIMIVLPGCWISKFH